MKKQPPCSPLEEQTAFALTREDQVAFLREGTTVWYATFRPVSPFEPRSAVVNLIQGIYEACPDRARILARNRIFTTNPLTELCWGMLKVAARRSSVVGAGKDHGLALTDEFRAVEPLSRGNDLVSPETVSGLAPMEAARALAFASADQQGNTPLFRGNRPVGAVLVGPAGDILAAASNRRLANGTLHAELCLVQGYFDRVGKAFPSGSRLYTTLKPCRMCASAIWTMRDEGADFHVYYDEYDPGPNARETILNGGSLERKRFYSNRPALSQALGLIELESKFSGRPFPGRMSR